MALGDSRRFSPLDYATFLVAIASIITGTYFLFVHEDNIRPLRDLQPIAKVGTYSESPQRKIVGTLAWNGVKEREVLFRGDQILTDQSSKIEVLFLDDTFLKIPPNSLIKLDFNNGEFDIVLIKGFLDINLSKGNEKVTLRKGNKKYKIEGKKGKIQVVSGSENLQFKPLSGDLKVDGKDASQLKPISKALYQIDNPLKKTTFDPLRDNTLPVDLKPASIKKAGNLPPPDVVISRYPNLRKAQKIKTTPQDLKKGLNLKLPRPGLYYLGVKEPGATEYKITPFEVAAFSAPQLLAQSGKKTIQVSQGENIALGWVGRKDLTYEVEVQAGSQRKVFDVQSTKKLLPIFKSAQLKYRVRVKSPSAPWSQWENQNVKVNPGLIVDQNMTPDIFIKKTQEDAIPFALSAKQSNPKSFLFEVAKTPSFKNPLFKVKSKKPAIKSKKLKPGVYYWRSTTLDKPPKTTGAQKITIKAPVILPSQNFKNEQFSALSKPVAQFSWSESLPGNKYQLTVKDTQGKVIEEKEVQGNQAEVKLPSLGSYSWQVKPLTNKEVLLPTKETPLMVTLPEIIKSPKIQPKQIIYYRIVNGVEAYEIELPEYKYAELYTLEVYRDPEAKKMLFKKSFPRNTGYWVSNRSGKYYYRVRITDKWGRKSGYSKMGILIFPISPLVKE